ncbi:hypothetical protein CPB83DRAFT_460633 [Crepidotus variabilis]|uniref:F-box domain-containing protein n=1 Tax=Crepidotus variabilis TaxID=179855 RepID=A0A9P6JN87_9AGAR|nr:hypothetical protein CPB83DRAFT_460633 [Crepidotus variabilis]
MTGHALTNAESFFEAHKTAYPKSTLPPLLQLDKRSGLDASKGAQDRLSQLPIELGLKIFGETCRDPFKAHPLSFTEAKNAESLAFGLASVCKFWRDLAYSTPVLWTSILLNVNSVRAELNSVLCWRFDLGRKLPLSLYVHDNLPETDANNPQIKMAELIVLQQTTFLRDFISRRINHIGTLVVHLAQPFFSAFELSRVADPSTLVELHLHRRGEDRYYDHAMTPITFDNQLALRKICIDSYPPEEVLIRWQDIQELKFDNIIIDDALPALAQASQVSVMDLSLNGSHGLVRGPPLPVVMPNMKSLRIRNDYTVDVFMSTCAMPSLNSLDVHDINGTGLWFSHPDFISFVGHCSSTLTGLSIGYLRDIIYEGFVSIIEHCPNLTNLDLRHYIPIDTNASRNVLHAIIKRLTLPSNQFEFDSSSNQLLSPHLQSLKVSVDFPLEWAVLVDLVASRQTPSQAGDIKRLRNLYLHFIGDQPGFLDLSCTRRILKLQEAGCSITLDQRDNSEEPFPNFNIVRESQKHQNLI